MHHISKNWEPVFDFQYKVVIGQCALNDVTQHLSHNFWSRQGLLKNWIGRLLRFFGNLKPAKISKNDTNIICLSSKDTLIFKITRTRLKNWALHAHFNFEIQFVISRSILKLKTSSSGFKLLRYRVNKTEKPFSLQDDSMTDKTDINWKDNWQTPTA